MTLDPVTWPPMVWVALIALCGTVIGVLVKWLGDNSTSRTTARTAREERVDKKIELYTAKIEERLEAVEAEAKEAHSRADIQEKEAKTVKRENDILRTVQETHTKEIETLHLRLTTSDRREALLYFHTKALRQHILNNEPPPPPEPPEELKAWFDQFEDTLPPVKS